MKQIIGIDYSYNSPAIATTVSQKEYIISYVSKKAPRTHVSGAFCFVAYTPPEDAHPIDKYQFNANMVLDAIDLSVPKEDVHFFFENYAFGVTTNVLTLLAENAGVLKYILYQQGYRNFNLLSPQTIKKFATGSGKSKKEQMYEAFTPVTGLDLSFISKSKKASPISDIVDAYWIMQAGIKTINSA